MEFDAAVGEARDNGIVRHHHNRASLLVKFAQQAQDDLFIQRIKIASRLVGKNNLRIVDQGPRDADALLLAPGKLRWQVMHPLAQAYAGQRFNRFFLIGHAVEVLRQHDIFDGGQKRNQMKLLEDESDLLGTHAIQFARGYAGDVLAVKPYLARGRPVEAANQIYECGLAGTRRTHNGQPFALRNMQRDVVERMNRAVLAFLAILVTRGLGGVEFGHVFNLDHFTLPSKSPPAAPAAITQSAGSPRAASPPCYQPAQRAGH